MAHDSDYTDWQPVQNIYNSPTRSHDTKDIPTPISSPPSHGTPYIGHSNQPYFTDAPDSATEFNYQSQSSLWDPLQQNPPVYHQKGDSFVGLLDANSPGNRGPNQRGIPPNRPRGGYLVRITELYKKHWKCTWSMCFFLFAGIAFACGHHFYYDSLDGTEPDQQLRKLRYGTALAFLSKTSLVTAVILAYHQCVWIAVRQKFLTIGTVDALFAAAEDITALFHWDSFRRAKIAMLLALYIWSTPLVVILTSQTISVQPKKVEQNTTCPGVMTLNFTHEATVSWRDKAKTEDGFYQLLLSYWNSTVSADDYDIDDPDSFDYWTGVSKQFGMLATNSKYLGVALSRDNARETVCGKGWNCTVTVDFVGPGYRCEEVASGVNDTVKSLGGVEAPFDTTQLAPVGDYIYYARTDLGDYENPQLKDADAGGIPKTKPPYPKNLGAFRTEPLIWIGYSVPRDESNIPENKKTNWTDDIFIPKIIGCEHYKTNYSIELSYTSESQSYKVLERNNISKVVDTVFEPGKNVGNEGLSDNTTATPQSNYIFPTDINEYRTTSTYHSIGKQLRDILNGTITLVDKVAMADVFDTRLIEKRNYLAVDNFAKELETFYEELVLSLLSNPQWAVVSWAQKPGLRAGQEMDWGYNHSQYDCTRQQVTNRYSYHQRDLWIVYAIAILLALIAVGFGIHAAGHINGNHDTRFSSIVAVTRGHSLNLVKWEKDGGDLKDVKVGFGTVRDVAGEPRQGFGLEGEVSRDRPTETRRSRVIGLRELRPRSARKSTSSSS